MRRTRPPFGCQRTRARTHFVLDREEVEALTQNAVVALLRLLQAVQVLSQVLLVEEGGAVDALEHLAALVAAPVRARHAEQLEVSEPARAGDMGPPAEVQEGPVAVDRYHLVVGKLVEPFELEVIVGEEIASLILAYDTPFEGVVGLDDPFHALLDGRDLIRGEGLGHVEVVVEAVVDGGAEADAGAGHEFAHRSGQNVSRGVAQHAERFGVAVGQEADRRAVGEGPAEVEDFTVDDRGKGRAGETRADRCGQVRGAGSRGQRKGAAVGQGYLDGIAFHGGIN